MSVDAITPVAARPNRVALAFHRQYKAAKMRIEAPRVIVTKPTKSRPHAPALSLAPQEKDAILGGVYLGYQCNQHVINHDCFLSYGTLRRTTVDEIIRTVAKHFDVTTMDIRSIRRSQNVILPRHLTMFLAKELTPLSLPQIGRRVGGKDHTTVIHAIRKIHAALAHDADLRSEVDAIRAELAVFA